jgi:hypothetical protein
MDAAFLSLHAQFHVIPKPKNPCGKNSSKITPLVNLYLAPHLLENIPGPFPCLLRRFIEIERFHRVFILIFTAHAIRAFGTGT